MSQSLELETTEKQQVMAASMKQLKVLIKKTVQFPCNDFYYHQCVSIVGWGEVFIFRAMVVKVL